MLFTAHINKAAVPSAANQRLQAYVLWTTIMSVRWKTDAISEEQMARVNLFMSDWLSSDSRDMHDTEHSYPSGGLGKALTKQYALVL